MPCRPSHAYAARVDTSTHRAALEAWLILLRTPGFGPASLRALIERVGAPPAALACARRGDVDRLDAEARAWLRAPDQARIDADLAWLADADHALLTFDEEEFPALLQEIPSPPAALFIAGDPTTLWRPQIAIVGSRNASHGGLDCAQSFARALALAGFTITSGLAEGIDAAAHAATLGTGGHTVAVLGTGPDVVFPRKHAALAKRIGASGALVSEFPPGTPGHPSHFPRRNRIISGLALGTLVIEASLRSGSLITARNAAEAGREVFAVPGSIHNPLARGCHQLIRNGARLVETAQELIAELEPLALRLADSLRERLALPPPAATLPPAERVTARRSVASPQGDDPDQRCLLSALGHEAVGIDVLAERTGFAVARLSSMLLMLELDGMVTAAGGGAFLRRPAPDSG